MTRINENFLKLTPSYLFTDIAKKVADYSKKNPDKKLIKMGIGDVTRPLIPAVIEAMHKATDEMGTFEGFHGYGPEQGYLFLRELICENDYYGLGIEPDEIFVSDGAKSDCGNIVDIFAKENKVAVCDPVYTVYVDTNVMSGRAGEIDENGKWDNFIYLNATAENNFVPDLPKERADIIYLCYPNNPTGMTISKSRLKAWVDYARENNSVILFDGAYEAFITEPDVPHSIFEIEGAKEVAVEFRSFSKTAGFTGTRCAYTVIPKSVKVNGTELNKLWLRRQCTKFNGVPYVIQRAAAAVYSEEGKKQVRDNILYYLENARIIKDAFESIGIKAYGGVSSPYVWVKIPEGKTSWGFFDEILEKAGVVTTPGAGFGSNGEGYIRLTAFNTREATVEAMENIKKLFK